MAPHFSIFPWTEMLYADAQRMQNPHDTLLAAKPDGARFSIFSRPEMRYANAQRKQNPYGTLGSVKNQIAPRFLIGSGTEMAFVNAHKMRISL